MALANDSLIQHMAETSLQDSKVKTFPLLLRYFSNIPSLRERGHVYILLLGKRTLLSKAAKTPDYTNAAGEAHAKQLRCPHERLAGQVLKERPLGL